MATGERERFGIETVAIHLAAKSKAGKLPHDATLSVAGRRIAVAVVATARNVGAAPRLRYDKVALRFMRDTETALGEAVPRGRTVVLTISAPIKLAAKTITAVHAQVRALLAAGSDGRTAAATILGNQVRVRILARGSARAPKVIAFVHTATPHPEILFDTTQALLDRIAAAAKSRAAGAQWLVLAAHDTAAAGAIYRHVVARVAAPLPFGKVLVVSDAGRVGVLWRRARPARAFHPV